MGAGIPVELALFAIFVGLSAFAVTMLLCLGLDLCFTNWQQRRYWRARARRLSSRRTTPPPVTSAASFPTASAPLPLPGLDRTGLRPAVLRGGKGGRHRPPRRGRPDRDSSHTDARDGSDPPRLMEASTKQERRSRADS